MESKHATFQESIKRLQEIYTATTLEHQSQIQELTTDFETRYSKLKAEYKNLQKALETLQKDYIELQNTSSRLQEGFENVKKINEFLLPFERKYNELNETYISLESDYLFRKEQWEKERRKLLLDMDIATRQYELKIDNLNSFLNSRTNNSVSKNAWIQ